MFHSNIYTIFVDPPPPSWLLSTLSLFFSTLILNFVFCVFSFLAALFPLLPHYPLPTGVCLIFKVQIPKMVLILWAMGQGRDKVELRDLKIASGASEKPDGTVSSHKQQQYNTASSNQQVCCGVRKFMTMGMMRHVMFHIYNISWE